MELFGGMIITQWLESPRGRAPVHGGICSELSELCLMLHTSGVPNTWSGTRFIHISSFFWLTEIAALLKQLSLGVLLLRTDSSSSKQEGQEGRWLPHRTRARVTWEQWTVECEVQKGQKDARAVSDWGVADGG